MATSNNLARFGALRREYSIFVILVIVFVGCSLISPNFLTPQNLSNVSKQIAISTIVAFGQTLLIIAGMLDLAAGSTLALSGLSVIFFYKATGLLVPSLFVGVFVGLFVSLITGLTVTKYKIPQVLN